MLITALIQSGKCFIFFLAVGDSSAKEEEETVS